METWTQALGALFALAVPLLLVCGSVTWAVNDPGLYRRGFAKYGVSQYTGIPPAELERAGAGIRRYFNSGAEPLEVRAQVWGEDRELFNQREVHHMRDVKGLVRGVYLAAGIALVYLLGAIVGGLVGSGAAFLPRLARWTLAGSLLTLLLVATVGLLSAVGFESLFLVFHQLSFSNDLWQLDPQRDYLLMMFPLGFWFDATLQVAAASVLAAVVLGAAAGLYLLTLGRSAGSTAKRKAGEPS